MLRGPFPGLIPDQPLRLSVLWQQKAAEAFWRVNFQLNDLGPSHLLHCAATATLVAGQDSLWVLRLQDWGARGSDHLRLQVGQFLRTLASFHLATSSAFLCIELGEL
jgi:hypothetical protein